MLMRQGQPEEGLGEEMYEAFKHGEEIPELDVEITGDDPPAVRSIKRLMLEMTSYHAEDRPPAAEVLQRIRAITMEARLDVEVSIRARSAL